MSTSALRVVGDRAPTPYDQTEPANDSVSFPTSRVGRNNPRHVLWINQHAAAVGGAEHYMANTAAALRERNVRSTLLYEVDGALDTDFLRHFDAAFPIVDLGSQVREISPDLIYAHRINEHDHTQVLAKAPVPGIRFIHDHKLFCLREHKYTTVGHRTCSRATGLGCHLCLGFVNRSEQWPGVRLRRLSTLNREQRLNRHFDRFVVGSRYMANHVAQHGFKKDKITVLPLYAAAAQAPPLAPSERRGMLFAGQLVRGKGLDLLLQAMQIARNREPLLVAGGGRQEELYRRMCADLGIADRVRFLGSLPSSELRSLLGRVRFLVVPSRAPETFGQVGVEAMAHATPVIASAVGGIAEWLQHEVTGLLTPSNRVPELAAALDRLAGDEDLRGRLGAAALHSYEKRFTPEKHFDNLETLFEDVAPRRGTIHVSA
jgi:glycosyltransferase involved in cell wall biosynthesis